jgi:AcrR family transcriptional regulator
MTMYKHFPSKSRLVVEVLKKRQDAFAAAVAATARFRHELFAVFANRRAGFRARPSTVQRQPRDKRRR